MPKKSNAVAVWALTPGGAALAGRIADGLPASALFVSASLESIPKKAEPFSGLVRAAARAFHEYSGHVFVMSAGIVVRAVAPLIRHKTVDPAVVVVDEAGHYAISLLSGHAGGANALAAQIADIIGAEPVITTATDVNALPAVDALAVEKNLTIENPDAIKHVSMALLKGRPVQCWDPFNILRLDRHPAVKGLIRTLTEAPARATVHPDTPGVAVDDSVLDLPSTFLILRPRSLVAGMGCNRNTPEAELAALLRDALASFGLAESSLAKLASIDKKADEAGLLALADRLDLPIDFFDKDALNRVTDVPNPSETVEKHMGVKSVCEAAALLGAENGTLIVPKQTTRNATVAVARIRFTSSA